jgi:hypothetical protein
MDVRCRMELLGRLRVTQGEREVTRFRTQKTGALLGYLAYHLHETDPRKPPLRPSWPETTRRSTSFNCGGWLFQVTEGPHISREVEDGPRGTGPRCE